MSFPIPLFAYNKLSFCFGHCIYVHSLSKTNLQLGGHSFLVLSKASGKGKIRGRCRFPESKKKRRRKAGSPFQAF